jgi:hypothetical protein
VPLTADLAVLERVNALEARRTPIAWIPEDGSSFVRGQGYRVAIVLAGDDGYHLTATWPYTGAAGETLPCFWGGPVHSTASLALVLAAVLHHNLKLGVTAQEAAIIVGRAMARVAQH